MTELIQAVDPGMLPPRTRRIYSQVATAIGAGWKPIELAQQLGVPASFLSELLGELRTALLFANGAFPSLGDEEYRALLESVAERGVEVPVVVDEFGVIDGRARVRACEELARVCDLAEENPDWREVSAAAGAGRAQAVELYGRDTVEACVWLAERAELVEPALSRRWENPPVDRREGLSDQARRALAVTLNAGRRHLTRGELRLLVEVELMLGPERSNVAIGRLVGCSHQYVAQIRQALAEDEARFGDDSQVKVDVQVVEPPWKPVTEVACPHCLHALYLERAGREYRLELGMGEAA